MLTDFISNHTHAHAHTQIQNHTNKKEIKKTCNQQFPNIFLLNFLFIIVNYFCISIDFNG